MSQCSYHSQCLGLLCLVSYPCFFLSFSMSESSRQSRPESQHAEMQATRTSSSLLSLSSSSVSPRGSSSTSGNSSWTWSVALLCGTRCCTWSQTGLLLSTQQPTFSSTASLAPSSDRAWRWCLAVDHQPQLVHQAQAIQQWISNPTQPNFDQKLKVSQKSKVANLSATVWKCQEWSWECETPDRNSSLNLSHQLWCEHLLDIKHSKSFRSTSYAMHVSESAATWLNHTLTREVKRDFWQV